MAKLHGNVTLLASEIAKKIDNDFYLTFLSQTLADTGDVKPAPGHWYELSNQEKPMTALAHRLFPGDPQALRRLGARLTRESTSAFHRFFMGVPNPKIVLLRAAKTWQSFYDTGEFEMELINPTTVLLHVRNFPDMPHYTKEITTGNFEGLGELMRRKLSITCDDSNRHDIRWQVAWA